MPTVNIHAMNHHLAEIAHHVGSGAIAVLVLDSAGWHRSAKLKVPDNIVLLPLPAYAPELNPSRPFGNISAKIASVFPFGTHTPISSMSVATLGTRSSQCRKSSLRSVAANGHRSIFRAIDISANLVWLIIILLGSSALVTLADEFVYCVSISKRTERLTQRTCG
jgi:hypothetical protein